MRCLVASDIESLKDKKLRFLKRMKEFSGIEGASNINQAINMLGKYSYGLVIIEISSSKEENMNLLKWIRKEKINIGVIMMSNENSADYIREAFNYGVCDYIVKPCSYKRFREAALRAVARREYLMQFKYMTQEEIDHFISLNVLSPSDIIKDKGISTETINIIKKAISTKKEGFTATDISHLTGLSRITARRYLEQMVSNSELKTKLEYGEIGRPQKIYLKIDK